VKRTQIEQFAQFIREEAPGGMSRRDFLRHGLRLGLSLPAALGVLAACGIEPAAPQPAPTAASPAAAAPTPIPPTPVPPTPVPPTAVPTATQAPTATPVPVTRFAVIGDFGLAGEPEQAVAALVKSWSPEFIVTTGDNNYPFGEAATIDANIGQYYHEFIAPYQGSYGPGAEQNRFYPVLGNHDWDAGYPRAYLEYFSFPEGPLYYTFDKGPARFFMLDSDVDEPDGVRADSAQAQWLQGALAAASERWKIVVMHHAPFSSGHHGPSGWMRWPFREWGASVVLAGHDHNYERIEHDGLLYFVNGLGGGARYAPGAEPDAGSRAYYNQNHGAMQVEMDVEQLRFQFVTRDGELVDEAELSA
jgi:tartrate-resistant acid phosphatase type 5